MSYVIGLDIGTTSTIGILLSLPDKILGHATRPVKLSSPFPGWAEENPEVIFSGVELSDGENDNESDFELLEAN